ncbi:MAG: class I SAM-dependent methyltransferase [Rhodospirillaceae bacterium]|nr:class I SAM-dependent methyltransferase [Rhodospirillaceae bacterium]
MNSLISPEYAALNKQLHHERADFGATAGKNAQFVIYYARKYGLKSVLDYGCGKGTLKVACATQAPDLNICEYDPAIEGKETMPAGKSDFLVALDVMEHIEPDHLRAVLRHIQGAGAKAVMLVIDLKPASKTLPDGRNAHLIVQPGKWWLNKLRKHFQVLHSEEGNGTLLYLGRPLPSRDAA